MKISDLFKTKKFVTSIEIFPPKTEQGLVKLLELLKSLEKYHPDYVSVTYGAGGSTRERTLDIVNTIKTKYSYEVMPHFTCVGHSRKEIEDIVQTYHKLGISNILALRGDPPIGVENFVIPQDGFAYASELIEYLKQTQLFDIGCAGFPECHVQSTNVDSDLFYLKRKIEKGSNFVITQFFFCNEKFYKWRDSLRALGSQVPLIPGIWLPSNEDITLKFSKFNQVLVPSELYQIYAKYPEGEDRIKACQDFTKKQVNDLLKNGIDGLHIYSFNQELPVQTISELTKV